MCIAWLGECVLRRTASRQRFMEVSIILFVCDRHETYVISNTSCSATCQRRRSSFNDDPTKDARYAAYVEILYEKIHITCKDESRKPGNNSSRPRLAGRSQRTDQADQFCCWLTERFARLTPPNHHLHRGKSDTDNWKDSRWLQLLQFLRLSVCLQVSAE